MEVIIVDDDAIENEPYYHSRPWIIPLSLYDAACKLINNTPQKEYSLTIDKSCIAQFPLNNLPNNIIDITCRDLGIHKLPGPLCDSITYINCEKNNISQLDDDVLPNTLEQLICLFNNMLKLPSTLPQKLINLDCSNNHLTHLPDILPTTLRMINCVNNKLRCLPDIIPPLAHFRCQCNNLYILPDFTITESDRFNTYSFMCYDGNKLDTLYPELKTLCKLGIGKINPNTARVYTSRECVSMKIEYINRRNREIRAEWLAKVNVGNVFLERYMQRMMHPSRLADLLADPNIDVDAFMESYVAGL
jgi:Leucine-rich repeat (LRR) protein